MEWIDTEALALEFPTEVHEYEARRKADKQEEEEMKGGQEEEEEAVRRTRSMAQVAMRVLATAR